MYGFFAAVKTQNEQQQQQKTPDIMFGFYNLQKKNHTHLHEISSVFRAAAATKAFLICW